MVDGDEYDDTELSDNQQHQYCSELHTHAS